MDLISVIVPIYKTEPFLRKCLDSIVKQTYENIEIILVDDGSTDNCGVICDEYAAQDRRIKVIHQANAGVSAARNAGLESASGDWIGFVDSDDFIEPDMYEYLLNLAQENGADLTQCGVFWEEPGRESLLYVLKQALYFPNGLLDFEDCTWRNLSNWTCTKLFRRNCVKDVRYDLAYPIGEDLYYVLHTLRRTGGIVIGAEAKYHYAQQKSSACNSVPSRDVLLSCRRMLARAILEFADCPAMVKFCKREQFRTDLDICSKLVCLHPAGTEDIEREIRKEIKRQLLYLLKSPYFFTQEKVKFFLIAWLWPIYRSGLPYWKARKGRLGGT